MNKLPSRITQAFERIRADKKGIYLTIINGKYYVYSHSYVWDKERKRCMTKAKYLGRIEEDGKFIGKTAFTYKDELERAKTLVEEYGGKITWQTGYDKRLASRAELEPRIKPQDIDKEILTALTMNGRIRIKYLANLIGINVQSAYHRVKTLEKQYGISYFTEVNMAKFGYTWYMAMVKFEKEKPDSDMIKHALEKIPNIQFAGLAIGEYDLLFCFLAKDNSDMIRFTYDVRSLKPFEDYGATWYVSPISTRNLPFRSTMLELIGDQIRTKTKDATKPSTEALSKKEFLVLKELFNNGNMKLIEIDKKNGFGIGASRYIYDKLIKRGIVTRISITLRNLPIKYNVGFFLYVHKEKAFNETRAKLLREIIEYGDIISKYTMNTDLQIPNSIFLIMPMMGDGNLNVAENHIEENIKGINLSRIIITEILLGELCYRRFDRAYTRQYELLTERYKTEEPVERRVYS